MIKWILLLFIILIIIMYLMDEYRKPKKNFYDESINKYIEVLSYYKKVDEYAYKKSTHHINRFYMYFFEENLGKMKKHFEKVKEYINRIPFRLENNLDRHKILQKTIENIYLLLIQRIYLVSNKQQKFFNDIKTTHNLLLVNNG